MELKTIRPNAREIELADGTRVLFSYSVPVAAYVPTRGLMRTEAFYSRTTSGHVAAWFLKEFCVPVSHAETVAQADLDRLLRSK